MRTTRNSASVARRAAINQLHALLFSGPDELRQTLSGLTRGKLVARCARLRVEHAASADPTATIKAMLRRLARRVQDLDCEIHAADLELAALIAEHALRTRAVFGAGDQAAAQLLMTIGDNPQRINSERALARLCGAAPIPASSGNSQRHRLHRGGSRAANSSLYMIVLVRLRWHEPTRAYVARRTAEGRTKKEIIRCLKRALVREIYSAITADFADLTQAA